MSDAMWTTRMPEQRAAPFHGWKPPAREPTPTVRRPPDGRENPDELAAVAVLSTN